MTKQEQAAAAIALLLLTRKASAALLAGAALTTRTLLAQGASPAQISQGLQSSQAALIVAARRKTRNQSATTWRNASGLDEPNQPVAQDALRAWTAASALAAAWSLAQRKLVRDEGLEAAPASRRATTLIASHFERTATTEVVHAWSAEVERLNALAAHRGYLVTETWSAALDACPRCWDLDGQSVTRPGTFPQYPPLHPRCRCQINTDIAERQSEAA